MNFIRVYFTAAVICVFAMQAPAAVTTLDLGSTRVDSSVWGCCNAPAWAQDYIASFNGWQYTCYYDAAGKVCVARRELPSGPWESLRISGYTTGTSDSHNNPAFGICAGDGTIHLAFDHHNQPLNYSVSVESLALKPDAFAWTSALFGPVTDMLSDITISTLTYPRFVRVPDGRLQFFFRIGGSGNGNTHLYEYDPATGAWTYPGWVFKSSGTYESSGSRNAYLNGINYGPDGRLHITWCWREASTLGENHDVCYVYSDDYGRTWYTSDGVQAGVTGTTPIGVTTPGIVVGAIARQRGLINQCAQALDSDGRIHAMVWHVHPDSASTDEYVPPNAFYYHYWRGDDGTWVRKQVFTRQSRPKIMFDDVNTLYLLADNARVYAATEAAGWDDWTMVYDSLQGGGEPVFDPFLWEEERILSIGSQETYVRDLSFTASGVAETLTVTVTDSGSGAPLPGAAVELVWNGRALYTLTADTGGNCMFVADTGMYALIAGASGYMNDTLAVYIDIAPGPQFMGIGLRPASVTGMQLVPDTLVLNQDAAGSFSASYLLTGGGTAPAGTALVWYSSDTAVATVDSSGAVTAGSGAGTAAIVCSSTVHQTAARAVVLVTENMLLNPAADAYVRNGTYADDNYGDEIRLMVKNGGTGYSRKSYLRFDMTTVGDKDIRSAQLRLYAYDNDITSTMQVAVYAVDDTGWTESGITWNTAPAMGTEAGRQTLSNATGVWYEWDVSSLLPVEGSSFNLGLADPGRADDNVHFGAGEDSLYPPELILGIAPPDDIPVELTVFTAAAGTAGVILEWATATETANLGFNVLRTNDTLAGFTVISTAMVPGAGTTVTPQQYSFVDTQATAGTWYYCLEQVDSSGGKNRSRVVSVAVLPSGIGAVWNEENSARQLPAVIGTERAMAIIPFLLTLDGSRVTAVRPGLYLYRNGMVTQRVLILR